MGMQSENMRRVGLFASGAPVPPPRNDNGRRTPLQQVYTSTPCPDPQAKGKPRVMSCVNGSGPEFIMLDKFEASVLAYLPNPVTCWEAKSFPLSQEVLALAPRSKLWLSASGSALLVGRKVGTSKHVTLQTNGHVIARALLGVPPVHQAGQNLLKPQEAEGLVSFFASPADAIYEQLDAIIMKIDESVYALSAERWRQQISLRSVKLECVEFCLDKRSFSSEGRRRMVANYVAGLQRAGGLRSSVRQFEDEGEDSHVYRFPWASPSGLKLKRNEVCEAKVYAKDECVRLEIRFRYPKFGKDLDSEILVTDRLRVLEQEAARIFALWQAKSKESICALLSEAQLAACLVNEFNLARSWESNLKWRKFFDQICCTGVYSSSELPRKLRLGKRTLNGLIQKTQFFEREVRAPGAGGRSRLFYRFNKDVFEEKFGGKYAL